jgi:hypothetical protein
LVQEHTTTPSAVFVKLVPTLATALTQLRRSPGRNEEWVDRVLESYRGRPEDRDRLCRRIGFARRLAELMELPERDRAAITVALLFRAVLDETAGQTAGHATQSWTEYLVRNEAWLARSYAICAFLEEPDVESGGHMPEVVATVAEVFDRETANLASRPLQVIEKLFPDPETPVAERVLPVLWSEAGQALCDHHFRRGAKGYRIDVQEIKGCLQVLRPSEVRAPSQAATAALRFSGQLAGKARMPSLPAAAPARSRPALGTPRRKEATADTFEERRRALRSGPGWGAILGAKEEAEAREESPAADETEQHNERPARVVWLPAHRAQREAEQAVPAEEPAAGEPAAEERPLPPKGQRTSDALTIIATIERLHSQLLQIQRMAAQSEDVLATLTPQIEELVSWIANVERTVEQFKHRPDEEAA